jgi:hypothetical protein
MILKGPQKGYPVGIKLIVTSRRGGVAYARKRGWGFQIVVGAFGK